MDSVTERLVRPARRSLAIASAAESAHRPDDWAERDEAVRFPAPGAVGVSMAAPSQMSARTRLAYGLLKAAMDEGRETAELQYAFLGAEWRKLHTQAISSVHASALAMIELMEALHRAEGPSDVATAQITHSRRQRDAMDRQMIEFLAMARNMISVLAAFPANASVDCSKPGKCASAPCNAQGVAERLKTLTERQRRVLELIAEGLPNKVIAYQLGLCETTVKAHVSGILRKLCVYNRARAIALLASIDLASIGFQTRS